MAAVSLFARRLSAQLSGALFSVGRRREDLWLQSLALPHPEEGEAAEGDGGAAGNRWRPVLPVTPQSGAQAPPPPLQSLRLLLHWLVVLPTLLV